MRRPQMPGKALPMTGWPIGPFLGSLFVGVPMFLILLPSAFVSQILKKIFVRAPRPIKTSELFSPPEGVVIKSPSEREFHLVMFGATGFTGRLAALYIAKNYGTKIRWALAGRNRAALEAIRKECEEIDPKLKDLPILIGDTSSPKTLEPIIANTRVIITTVGPFVRYGTPVVALCAAYGTGYCDITGETDWVRQTIDRYDETARKSGARIVHFCGHDCVPWDLVTLQVAKKLQSKGEHLTSISLFDELRGEASGGTLETVRIMLDGGGKATMSVKFDPLLKKQDGQKSANQIVVANSRFLNYSNVIKAWVGPFVMAAVNANCVKRSNALLNYGPKLHYSESVVHSGFMAGVTQTITLMVFGATMLVPPVRALLYKYVLPKPGQGPSAKAMEKGFLLITAVGIGSKGSKVRGMAYFPTDPGYKDTARMLVESGLALALDGDRIKVPGGVYTPAACQGEILVERLVRSGSTFLAE